MENYGNDLFLSQEGCPSLDFTLLDRPSSSVVPTPGATVPLFPGENSFPSFDIFDGAGVESFDDRSFPGHRSHTSEPQKDSMKRNVSTHSGLVQKQMHGVRDFFGQDNRQQHMGSSLWSGTGSGGSHFQSQCLLSEVGNAEDLGGGNMRMKDTLLAGMPTGDGGFTSRQALMPLGEKRFPNDAGGTLVASQVRNQPGGALQYSSDALNSTSNALPPNNCMLEYQLTGEDTTIRNAPYQNQYGRYASHTSAGVALNEAQRLDFLANPLRPARAAHEPHLGGPPTGAQMTELPLLQQQALQFKHEQALQFKQKQALMLQQQEVLKKQEAIRMQQGEILRVQQQEAVQLQQQEAVRMQQQQVIRTQQQLRVQQQEAVQLQQQEAVRMQQQEVMRTQQQEGMLLQQQEMLRMQQQEGVRLKQQGVMRKQQQEAMRLQQHETTWAQQESMQSHQYEAMWSRQHDGMQSEQQDVRQSQSHSVTQSRQQGATQSQQHEVMRSQQQALWSRKQQVLWSQQRGLLESQQKQSMQPQQQNAWKSKQQEAWQPQQVLPPQQQQALRLALLSQQHQAWQTQRQQALLSRQQQPLHPLQQQALHSQQQQALQMQQQVLQTQQQQQTLPTQEQQQALQAQQQASPFQQRPPLQAQCQLQEFFVGQQLNQQPDHSGSQHIPQETCTEFLGTSYSALLHGPDTPPSQPQLGEEPLLSELDDQTAAFSSANTQNFSWPIDGTSYNQGLPNDPSMAQNIVEPHDLHSGSSPAEVTVPLGAEGNFSFVQNAEAQNILPEFHDGGLMSSSIGKPMFQADKTNESSIEHRKKHQVHAQLPVQSWQYGGEQLFHGLDNDSHQIKLLSQSQQHFQGPQLRQQRSWESFGQKQDVSKPSFSEATQSLSQSISMPDRNTLQTRTQQNWSSLGPRNGSCGNDSYQSGRIHTDNAADFKQHQRFATGGVEAPRRINMDGEDGKCFNSWNAMQPHQMGRSAAYYSHQISDSKHEIWGNKAAQQATHIVQNSSSSVSPSDSTQGAFNSTQKTPLDGRVLLAAPSSLLNQESSKLNQESGLKENKRAAVLEQTTLSLSESDQFSHGFWKRHASLQESVGGLDSMREPLRKVGSGSIWNHISQPEKLALEAPFDGQALSNISNSMNDQATAGQGTNQTQFLGQEGVSQQIQKQPDLASNPYFSSSVNAFNGVTTTMISNENDNGQICLGSLAGEQRISQQHIDQNASNVSLAHLRHSHQSSPLSPKYVKLGLGPSNLPQSIQQAGHAGLRISPLRDGLVRKGPTSNLEGKKFNAASPYGGSVHENLVKNKAELNQGIGTQLNGMVLQNNGRPSSALSNSSSFSKESADSETLAPSSFPSAHHERYRVSQGTVKSGGNSVCGAENFQTGSLDDEPLASLQGKLLSVSDSSKQPSHSGGDSEGKLLAGYQQPNNNSSSLRVLQNQQIINMALKQLGNRAQNVNLAGLLTTLKTSLSEHSKDLVGTEKNLPGIVESDWPQSNSGQTGGYVGGNAPQSIQRPQMILRKTSTGLQDISTSKPRVAVEHNNQEKQSSHTSEPSGSASTSLLEDLQRQRIQSLSLMNGYRSHSLHSGGQCEDEVEFTGSKFSNFVPTQADSQLKGAEASFALSGQSQYLQQQRSVILEGSSLHQTLKEPIRGAAWAATLPNLAVKAVGKPNEALSKSLDGPPTDDYVPKVSLGQQDADAVTEYKSLTGLKEIQQQNAFDSEHLNKRGLSLPKPVAKSVVNAVSLTVMDKGANSVLESDVEALHKSRLHSGNSNDQVLSSQGQRCDNSTVHGKLITSSYISLVNEQAQPAASGDRDTHGKEDPNFQVEEAKPGIQGHTAASNKLSQYQVSPSKTSPHGIVAVHPKKRKKPIPLLIPWHIAAGQPSSSLPSISNAELTWANAANRLAEKDDSDLLKDNVSSGFRAKRRLKLTTRLMQQLIPPLPSRLMHGNSLVDDECASYSLAKLALEDACRLTANSQREASSACESSENKNMSLCGQQGRTWSMAKNVAVVRCVESFVERAKRLDGELARVDSSTLASELRGEIYDLERMAIVNRLARHHGTGLTVDSSEICLRENIPDIGTGIRKPSPKRYVTPAPMPRTLPSVKCLSL